ncbi:hypothetical protein CPB83DRAFT_821757 [Crepidotus variabilis]|uniref:BTB domain-containing protein n=1 Tax=Crepidotus variabilis TaxID=179855 RepID=A0A9P6JJH3_9AGAR|nr:hypothetical protein CPB83DRAFT_821757 [Crepidotus variabilis]
MPDVHEKFNLANANVVIQSSDGVQFYVHRKNLEMNTGTFPGAEFDTSGEIVHLTEPSEVLEVIFQFVYPQRYPLLEDREFDSLCAIAEAVEKYEVFPAMHTCMYALRQPKHIKDHAPEILCHALKHNYPELVDMIAPKFLLLDPVTTAKKLPVLYVLPWFEYYQACLATVFKKVENYSTNLLSVSGQCYIGTQTTQPQVCHICLPIFFKWLWRLREASSQGRLEEELQKFSFYESSKSHCSSCNSMGSPHRCIHATEVPKLYRKGLSEIPSFSLFLSTNRN